MNVKEGEMPVKNKTPKRYQQPKRGDKRVKTKSFGKNEILTVEQDGKEIHIPIPTAKFARNKTRELLRKAIIPRRPKNWGKMSRAQRSEWMANKAIRELNEFTEHGTLPGYRKSYDNRVFKYCLLGLSDEEIAALLDISVEDLTLWKTKYPSFMRSFIKGREDADADVAFGLYNRARGMTIPDTYLATYFGKIISKPIIKHLPPDVRAASLWLNNRRGENWRQTQVPPGSEGDGNVPPPTRVEIVVKDARKRERTE